MAIAVNHSAEAFWPLQSNDEDRLVFDLLDDVADDERSK